MAEKCHADHCSQRLGKRLPTTARIAASNRQSPTQKEIGTMITMTRRYLEILVDRGTAEILDESPDGKFVWAIFPGGTYLVALTD